MRAGWCNEPAETTPYADAIVDDHPVELRTRLHHYEETQSTGCNAMIHGFSLMLFIVLVLGGGLLIGFFNVPGDWYAKLAKPAFTPPGWVFGPAWTVLYILIAIAGWRTWRRDRSGSPMKLWWMQLALNFLWSPIFFSAHQVGLALAVIALMLAAILGFIAASWQQDRVAALLFVPYAAWVSFATLLNGSIFALN